MSRLPWGRVRLNRSDPVEIVELIRRANAAGLDIANCRVQQLQSLFPRLHYGFLSQDDRKSILKRYTASNAAIRDRYFLNRSRELFAPITPPHLVREVTWGGFPPGSEEARIAKEFLHGSGF